MNKNIEKNKICQQYYYFCQYLQYARFKRMGRRAEMQTGQISK